MKNSILTAAALTMLASSQLMAEDTTTGTHKGWYVGYKNVWEKNICAHGGEGGCPGFPKPIITPENSVLGGFKVGMESVAFLRIDTESEFGNGQLDKVALYGSGPGTISTELTRQDGSDKWYAGGSGWTLTWNGYNGTLVYENDDAPFYRKASMTIFYLSPPSADETAKSN